MELELASLISGQVIMWQVILAGVQYTGLKIGGKLGLAIAAIAVFFWTISNTYNDLRFLQLIVQGGFAYFLFQHSHDEKENSNSSRDETSG